MSVETEKTDAELEAEFEAELAAEIAADEAAKAAKAAEPAADEPEAEDPEAEEPEAVADTEDAEEPVAGAPEPEGAEEAEVAAPPAAARRPRVANLPRPEGWAHDDIIAQCGDALAGMAGNTLRSIGITSCGRGEGRSTIAAAMALVHRCSYNRRTLLVELDFTAPVLAQRLALGADKGLADVLRGEATLAECVQEPHPDLFVLPAGAVSDDDENLEAAVLEGDLFEELQAVCDTLILDLPPLIGNPTAAALADRCDKPILVVRAGTTPVADIRRAAASLADPPPVLLNRTVTVGPRWLNAILGSRS